MPATLPEKPDTFAIVVMGVSGSGKSSVGKPLADRLGIPFRDADEFHSRSNIAKMSAGIPLTDADRWPWLDAIGKALHDTGGGLIVACSALKRSYRDRLRQAAGRPVTFVWLAGSKETIARRMQARQHHFMPLSLLDSQFATLEPPQSDEDVIRVSVDQSLEEEVDAAFSALAERAPDADTTPSV